MNSEEKIFDFASAKKTFSRIGFALIAFIAASYAAAFLLELLCLLLLPESMYTSSLSVVISCVAMYGVGVPIFAACVRRVPKNAPKAGRARLSTIAVLLGISVAFMYFGSLVGSAVYGLVSDKLGLGLVESTLDLVSTLPWYVALAFTVLLAPIFEELVFRKLIIDRVGVYGEKLAILFSALLFAFFHMSIQQFFYAFLLGLLLGYLYLRTGRLIYPYIIHAAVNFIGSVIPLLLMQYAGYNEILEATTSSPTEMIEIVSANPIGYVCVMLYSLALIAAVIIGCVLFGIYRRKLHFNVTALQLPRDSEAVTAFTAVGVIIYIAICVILPIVLSAM